MKSNVKSYYRKLERAAKREKRLKRLRINKVKTLAVMKKVYTDDAVKNLIYRPMPFADLFGVKG